MKNVMENEEGALYIHDWALVVERIFAWEWRIVSNRKGPFNNDGISHA